MRPIRGSNGIPVGKDGKVPFKAIVRRFHEVGSRKDADSTDSIVLPRELTPSQIREWWDDPSVCDIEGVDTEDSDIYSVPISHGEGRFLADSELIRKLAENGQIATQYVDLDGKPTADIHFNPNNSAFAIEGITSPDGRVFGKMGHSERIGGGLYKNVGGNYDIGMLKAAVEYYK